jgi:hypothetical protein
MGNNKLENVEGALHVEISPERHDEKSTVALKLDKHGFPLVPQPSDHNMDPLNWSPWLKMAVLAQISAISFLSLLAASLIVGSSQLCNKSICS